MQKADDEISEERSQDYQHQALIQQEALVGQHQADRKDKLEHHYDTQRDVSVAPIEVTVDHEVCNRSEDRRKEQRHHDDENDEAGNDREDCSEATQAGNDGRDKPLYPSLNLFRDDHRQREQQSDVKDKAVEKRKIGDSIAGGFDV